MLARSHTNERASKSTRIANRGRGGDCLVRLLRGQRSAAILRRTGQSASASGENGVALASLCESFVRMYRPHAAREDTEIFPALRAALGRHAVDELGERLEQMEHTSVGEGGFEHAVNAVAQ